MRAAMLAVKDTNHDTEEATQFGHDEFIIPPSGGKLIALKA